MPKVRVSVFIKRPIEEVFEFVSDLENDPKYRPAHLEAKKTTTGPIEVGTSFRQVMRAMGRQDSVDFEITQYEPNRRVAFKHTAFLGMAGSTAFEVDQVDGGTEVTFTMDGKMQGLNRVFGPIMGLMLKKVENRNLANLKTFLESDDQE